MHYIPFSWVGRFNTISNFILPKLTDIEKHYNHNQNDSGNGGNLLEILLHLPGKIKILESARKIVKRRSNKGNYQKLKCILVGV